MKWVYINPDCNRI